MKTTIMRVLALAAMALPLGLKAQSNFTDNCTTFDSSLWDVANYGMGRGSMLPADIAASGGGVYNFKVPADTYNGAEIFTKGKYSYGHASTSMKCCGNQGVLNSIYMYQGTGSSSDEIDIEVYKNSGGTWEIAFTVYKASVKEWVKVYYPSWDPSAGYNTYDDKLREQRRHPLCQRRGGGAVLHRRRTAVQPHEHSAHCLVAHLADRCPVGFQRIYADQLD